MAGDEDVERRYDWINLAPSPSIRLTMPGIAASATHRSTPYRLASEPSSTTCPTEDQDDRDDERLLSAVSGRAGLQKPPKRSGRCRTCLADFVPNTTLTRSLVLILLVQGIVCVTLEAYLFQWYLISFERFADACSDALPRTSPVESCGDGPDVMPFCGPLVTIILESFFQIYLSVDAARRRNVIQVVGICLNNFCLCVFISLSYLLTLESIAKLASVTYGTFHGSDYISPENIRGCFYALILLPTASTVALCLLARKFYSEFEW